MSSFSLSIFVCLGEFVQEIVGLVFCQPSFQQGILICFWCYLVSSSELLLTCTCLIVLSCLFLVQEVWRAHWENLQQDPAGQIPVGCWHGNSWFPVLMTTSMLDAKTQSIRRAAWKERLSHFIWHWCFSYSNVVFYTKSTSADISGQFQLQVQYGLWARVEKEEGHGFGERTDSKEVGWCFTPSQPVQLYHGDEVRQVGKTNWHAHIELQKYKQVLWWRCHQLFTFVH